MKVRETSTVGSKTRHYFVSLYKCCRSRYRFVWSRDSKVQRVRTGERVTEKAFGYRNP